METFFADTSFFVAYYNSKDVYHNAARALAKEFEARSVLMIITDYIFDEVMTVLLVKGNKHIAIQAGRAIMADPNIEIFRVDEELFNQAWDVFQGFGDKRWSFTDCTSYVLMKKLNVEVGISFDGDFKQFGVRVVP